MAPFGASRTSHTLGLSPWVLTETCPAGQAEALSPEEPGPWEAISFQPPCKGMRSVVLQTGHWLYWELPGLSGELVVTFLWPRGHAYQTEPLPDSHISKGLALIYSLETKKSIC